MKIFIYSNCQGRAFRKFLPRIINNIEVNHVENYLAFNDPNSLDLIERFAEEADVFIYQPLPGKYGRFSTDPSVDESVCSHLRRECLKVSVPYAYNDGLWPLFEEGGNYKGGYIIERYINDGAEVEEIIGLYNNFKIDFELAERYNRSIKLLKKKEESCDIKIADFIDDNISSSLMFRTQNHPTTKLFANLMRSFIEIIGRDTPSTLSAINDLFCHENNNLSELPLYWPVDRYSLNTFGFKFLNEPDDKSDNFYTDCIKTAFAKWSGVVR